MVQVIVIETSDGRDQGSVNKKKGSRIQNNDSLTQCWRVFLKIAMCQELACERYKRKERKRKRNIITIELHASTRT